MFVVVIRVIFVVVATSVVIFVVFVFVRFFVFVVVVVFMLICCYVSKREGTQQIERGEQQVEELPVNITGGRCVSKCEIHGVLVFFWYVCFFKNTIKMGFQPILGIVLLK